jgi:hypothetical protein
VFVAPSNATLRLEIPFLITPEFPVTPKISAVVTSVFRVALKILFGDTPILPAITQVFCAIAKGFLAGLDILTSVRSIPCERAITFQIRFDRILSDQHFGICNPDHKKRHCSHCH